MSNIIPGTDIELYKWYPATQLPPDIMDEDEFIPLYDKYQMVLAIEHLGIQPGFYTAFDKTFSVHVQRYDDFDDEPVPGFTRSEEINTNLDWEYEKAYGVTAWMYILDPPEGLPVAKGYEGNYWDEYGKQNDEDEDEEGEEDDYIDADELDLPRDRPEDILPIHPN